MNKTFGITVTAKMRHAALLAACRKVGTTKKTAEHLGVHLTTLYGWIALKECPRFPGEEKPRRNSGSVYQPVNREKFADLEAKLFVLTGQTMEELFPAELRQNAEFLTAKKEVEITRDVDVRMLPYEAQERFLLPSPADEAIDHLDAEEKKAAISRVLKTLSYREREIIKLRYGLGGDGETYTLSEIGHIFKVSRDRIMQLEHKAVRKMGEGERRKILAPLAEADD